MRESAKAIVFSLIALMLSGAALAQGASSSDKALSESMPELAQVEQLDREGRSQEAEQLLVQIRTANPTRVEPLIFIGERLMQQSVQAAIPYFEQAMQIDAYEPHVHANFARIQAAGGQTDAALARLTAAQAKLPNSAVLWIARSEVETRRQNPAGALAALTSASNLTTPPAVQREINARRADILMSQQKRSEAEAVLNVVLSTVDEPARRLQRGDARYQQQKLAEALSDYEAVAATAFGQDAQMAPQVALRISTVKSAASQVLTIDASNRSKFYTLVTSEESLRPFTANGDYHCNDGALVFSIDEITAQPDSLGLGAQSTAPMRVVGQAGVAGTVTLVPNLIDPNAMIPNLFNVKMTDPAQQASLANKRNLKLCPVN